jgi:hypothetical protein
VDFVAGHADLEDETDYPDEVDDFLAALPKA